MLSRVPILAPPRSVTHCKIMGFTFDVAYSARAGDIAALTFAAPAV